MTIDATNDGTQNQNDEAARAAAEAAAAGAAKDGQTGDDGKGSAVDFAQAFAELEPESRAWLEKQGFLGADGAKRLGQHVINQEKLLGNAIRIPGKDAKPEEREAFLNKLGRPEKAEGYEFAVPKDLPESLPYDGERATEFKTFAHSIGLTQAQAAQMHDWYVGRTVADHGNAGKAAQNRMTEKAKAETAKLEKLWGPLDSPTAKANLEFGHRFLTNAGNAEVMADLKAHGLVGEDGIILSAPIAQLFANAGAALYKEGEVLRGDKGRIDNPFADKTENVTEQMRLVKGDRGLALSLIVAAGKKPEDFGLSG